MDPRYAPYTDESRPLDCRSFEIGYDLDGGGYTTEYVDGMDHDWSGCITWDNPEWPYTAVRNSDIDLLVMDVGSYCEREWPTRVEYVGRDYFLLDEGRLNGSDHECDCRGYASFGSPDSLGLTKDLIRIAEVTGVDFKEALDFFGLEWEYTGDCGSKSVPYPACTRCEGEGYVDSPGGPWAVYRHTAVPTSVNLRAVCDAVVALIDGLTNGTAAYAEDYEDYREPVMAFMASDEGRFARKNRGDFEVDDHTDESDMLEAVEKLTRGGVYLGTATINGFTASLDIRFVDESCTAIMLAHGYYRSPVVRIEV